MVRSLWTGAAGMKAQQTSVDTIANNLANVNTTGYKTQSTQFKSLLYQTIQTVSTTSDGTEKPTSAQVGLGSRVAAINASYTQGAMLASDNNMALCIEGSGFFAVQGVDGGTYYTRNGDFSWATSTNAGQLVLTDDEGHPVLDTAGNRITLPSGVGTTSVTVGTDGAVAYRLADGTIVRTGQSVGLYQFDNPKGLEKMSDNLLEATASSGAPINEATTALNITPSTIAQGYLEGSNVNVADEMVNLIIAQRAYEMNSKAITTSDTMLDEANQLKR